VGQSSGKQLSHLCFVDDDPLLFLAAACGETVLDLFICAALLENGFPFFRDIHFQAP
jgi:hypothetical protein